MTAETNYKRIIDYIELIQRKPGKEVKFFHFDDGKKFIIDGNKLNILPFNLHHLKAKDEFYVHINPLDKKVMYYAFDIEEYISSRAVNEEEGILKWDDIETCIYNFFVMNIKELTDATSPHSDVYDPSKSSHHNTPYTPPVYTPPSNGYGGSYGGNYSYGSPEYKEREAFYDKLWPLIKEGKTTIAMDLIEQHIGKMCDEKKFEDLDTLIRLITFDKLNIPTMLGILNATSANEASLKARRDFFDKVKTHITKIKPDRAGAILKGLEPGKIRQERSQA